MPSQRLRTTLYRFLDRTHVNIEKPNYVTFFPLISPELTPTDVPANGTHACSESPGVSAGHTSLRLLLYRRLKIIYCRSHMCDIPHAIPVVEAEHQESPHRPPVHECNISAGCTAVMMKEDGDSILGTIGHL